MTKAKEFLTLTEDTKKDRMYSQIKKHGENLNAIFKTDLDPIALSKKLFALERKLQQANMDAANGDIKDVEQDRIEKQVLAAVDKLLGYKAKNIPVFNNDDPRGFSLKIDDAWVHKNNVSIYTDMGGYGILAPDFSGRS